MSHAFITATGLAHAYGQTPLFSNLSLQLQGGQVLQLCGRNGAGKTTLLGILAGLKAPHEGTVERAAGATLLYVGHQSAIKAELSPLENLALYEPDATKPAAALETMELPKAAHNHPCYRLSAGQQRKVALARLILSKADIWLVDEPFTALDDTARTRITRLIEAHARSGGAALIATHDPLPVDASLLQKMVLA